MAKSKTFGFIAVLLLVISSCERPFVEETPPEILILNPNTDDLQTARAILISVDVSSQFRDIESVLLNSVEMDYISNTDTWRGNLDLEDGVNTFVIQARDTSGLEGRLEGSYLHFVPQVSQGTDLPVPRAGHSISPNPGLEDGEFLLIGGSQSTSRDALGDIIVMTVVNNEISYQNSENDLNHPRAGHTATRMNDGNTLIIGGSRRAEARDLDDLLESVERYNNETKVVDIVPFEGFPIRRSRHAATKLVTSDGRELIYLLGGQGDIRYGTDPRLGIRDDLRLFEYRNDSLVAIPPEPNGLPLLGALAGHSMVALNQGNGSGFGKYIVSSTEFDSSDNFSAVHSEVEITESSRRRIDVNSTFKIPRSEFAAARFFDGHVGFFGGRGFAQNTALQSSEIYSARTLQYYLLPSFPQMRKERWDLTATKLPDGRILLTGGFDNAGNALRDVDFFSIL